MNSSLIKSITNSHPPCNESRRNYAEAAKLYELHIGAVLREDPESHAAADLLLTELQPITTAWAQSTGQALDRVLEASYGWSGGDRYYGAFRMTARNINHVFQQAATRPLREKLKIGYNAIRNNNLAKWLKVAAQQLFMQINMPLAPRDISVENVDDTTTENVDANFAANSGLALKMIAYPQHYLEAFNAAVVDEPDLGDRRMTFGETKEQVRSQVEALIPKEFKESVKLQELFYDEPSYTGFVFPVDKYFPAWALEEDHPLVRAGQLAREQIGLTPAPSGKWNFSTTESTGRAKQASRQSDSVQATKRPRTLSTIPSRSKIWSKGREFYAILLRLIT